MRAGPPFLRHCFSVALHTPCSLPWPVWVCPLRIIPWIRSMAKLFGPSRSAPGRWGWLSLLQLRGSERVSRSASWGLSVEYSWLHAILLQTWEGKILSWSRPSWPAWAWARMIILHIEEGKTTEALVFPKNGNCISLFILCSLSASALMN